jgi:hypothetical protein
MRSQERQFFQKLLSELPRGNTQGCQMVSFQTKKSQFWKILKGLRLENVYILYGHLEYIFYGRLRYFMTICPFVFIWCIFSGFGIMYREKSGNPDEDPRTSFFPETFFGIAAVMLMYLLHTSRLRNRKSLRLQHRLI